MLSTSTAKETKTEKTLGLKELFPVILSGEKCPICEKELKNHSLHFFLDPKHVEVAEEVLKNLTISLQENLKAYITLSSNAGPSEVSTKDIMENLMKYIEGDPRHADIYSRYLIHHVSSQKLEFNYRTLGDMLFRNVKTKLWAFTAGWEEELRSHRILGSEKFFRFYHYGYREKDGDPLVSGSLGEDDVDKEFLAVHEIDAMDDYTFLRKQFYNIAGLIEGFQKATEKLMKTEPYAAVKKAIKTRGDRPIIVQSRDTRQFLRTV